MLATCRHNVFSQSSLRGSSVVIWKLSSLLLSSVGGLTTRAKAFWQSTVYWKKSKELIQITIFPYNSGGELQKGQPSVCQELELQTTWFGVMIVFIYTIAVVSLARAEFCPQPSSRGCNQLFMRWLILHQIICRAVSLTYALCYFCF